jgi:hypothetical protein
MMMTRHVTSLLAKEGRIPVIASPNPKDPNLSGETAFGPMLDSNHQPCKPGTLFLASTIYKKFHLKKGKGFNDAWNSDFWQAGCGILRLAEKNGLPFDVPIGEGMSPLGEVMRIVASILAIGFFSSVRVVFRLQMGLSAQVLVPKQHLTPRVQGAELISRRHKLSQTR